MSLAVDLISVDPPQGDEPGAGSSCNAFALSADGRYVAYLSGSKYQVAGEADTNHEDDIFRRDAQDANPLTRSMRVSKDSSGGDADNWSNGMAISGDGRYVAFTSVATDLVESDTNGLGDVFVRDAQDSNPQTWIKRVSTDSDDNQVHGTSEWPAISADGRYVAFESSAPDLVPGDNNGRMDVFRKDWQATPPTVIRVSIYGQGQPQRTSFGASISGDGNYIAFASVESYQNGNPIPGKYRDIFVYDVTGQTLTRVTTGDADSWWPVISADGRYVAFYSFATNLVGQGGDTNGVRDVFVWDRETDTITLVSTNTSGAQGNGQSYSPAISANGRFVAFASVATNLVSGDNNGWTDVFVKDMKTGTIVRVSTDSTGHPGNNVSVNPAISADGKYVLFKSTAKNLVTPTTSGCANVYRVTNPLAVLNLPTVDWVSSIDGSTPANWYSHNTRFALSDGGRYVAFTSAATYLVSGDTNDADDIFVKDLQTGAITRASTDGSGNEANDSSSFPAISTDGRYVAFQTYADNLVSGDTGYVDIFVKDLQTGAITRASTDSSGNEANGNSWAPAISADGRYVALTSAATNLDGDDTNEADDIFVKDLQGGTTTRVSTNTDDEEADGQSMYASISADGRYVAFDSYATNLVDDDNNGDCDVFVKDRESGDTTRLSTDIEGHEGDGGSFNPAISGDGLHVLFDSWATNLVSGDTNGTYDAFVKDVQTPAITRASTDSVGNEGNSDSCYCPAISAEGRYVAFTSRATNLVSRDTNDEWDIFVKDVQTGRIARVSTDSDGNEGNGSSCCAAITADGRYIAFSSFATNLVGNDTNGYEDVFRVSNPLLQIIDGTSGNDVFGFSTDGTYLYVSVTLDGQPEQNWTYDASLPLAFTFIGRGGNDQINISGGPANETVVTYPTAVTFTKAAGTYQVIADGFNAIQVTANAGTNQTATMYDAHGTNDRLDCQNSSYAEMTRWGSYEKLIGFDRVKAYASGDPDDQAHFYDSAANDTFEFHAQASEAFMQPVGGGFYNYASGFAKYYGHATMGGSDRANLYDSSGNDGYTAWANRNAQMECAAPNAPDAWVYGFELNYGYFTAGGADDEAYLYDSAADDTFNSAGQSPDAYYLAKAVGPSPYFSAVGGLFDTLYVFATAGGYDKAWLLGTDPDPDPQHGITGDDAFTAYGPRSPDPAKAIISTCTGRNVEVQRFEEVYADLKTGNDTANLYDSDATLTTDYFWGARTHQDPAWSDAVLSDGALNPANGNLTTPGTYYFRVTGLDSSTYDRVNLFGSDTGGANKKHIVGTLDYFLAVSGPWTDW